MTDKEIRQAARSFRKGMLGKRQSRLMCFAICAPLQAMLSICGCDTELVEADFGDMNHVWLRLSDGRILDPTADQFGLAPVYLGPVPIEYRKLMRNKRRRPSGTGGET